MVISCEAGVISVRLDDVSFEITGDNGKGGGGIGAYPGGNFEVYGSEGLYLTSDDDLVMSVYDNLICNVDNNLTISYGNELYINEHYIDFPFNSGAFEYTFPKKSGTIALLSDMKKLYHHSLYFISDDASELPGEDAPCGQYNFSLSIITSVSTIINNSNNYPTKYSAVSKFLYNNNYTTSATGLPVTGSFKLSTGSIIVNGRLFAPNLNQLNIMPSLFIWSDGSHGVVEGGYNGTISTYALVRGWQDNSYHAVLTDTVTEL